MEKMSWSLVLMKFTYLQAAISLVLLAGACVFFYRSAVQKKKAAAPVQVALSEV